MGLIIMNKCIVALELLYHSLIALITIGKMETIKLLEIDIGSVAQKQKNSGKFLEPTNYTFVHYNKMKINETLKPETQQYQIQNLKCSRSYPKS